MREIDEELGICIKPTQFLCNTKHEYPTKKISLHFYLCNWVEGAPKAREVEDFRWIMPDELKNFKFPEGDEDIIEELIRKQDEYFKQ